MTAFIEDHRESYIQTIRLNRADKKNALTPEMYLAIAQALHSAQSDKKVRVTVLTGSGDSFTAGNDIGDFVSTSNAPKGEKSLTQGPAPFPTFLGALMAADKPVIAAINGLAIGVGVTMLMHCDMVYAADTARFGMPFVNLGAVPEAGSSVLIPNMLGRMRAMELFLLGDQFNAQKAQELGFVNAVFPAAQLMQEVMTIAARIAAKPPSAVRETKRLVREHGALLEKAIREEGRTFDAQLRTPESKEAMKAFSERRPADFSRFE
ncbi:MAG TPA: enoyl-CoA hydratase [Alphaproteobacteria bacterium]|nr:enoyl-CoA hydratase [Alphaproteobacteria bacterium]